MVFVPRFVTGISGDLGVEDEKACLKFGHMGTNPVAVLFQQRPAIGASAGAEFPQCRIAQHFPDRHSRRFQATEKFDPDEDGCVIVPLARSIPVGVGKQPDPLVIANRVS